MVGVSRPLYASTALVATRQNQPELLGAGAGLASAVAVESGTNLGETVEIKARGYWEQVWIRFRRDTFAIGGGVFIIVLFLVAFVGAPIAAGCLVTRSIPPGSLVQAEPPTVRSRGGVGPRSLSAAATARMNSAPSSDAVRSSRCGERGPDSDPPPSSAPRRYAPRQQERATIRRGGRSSGAPRRSTTPASRSTARADSSPATWSWYRVA